MGAEDSTSESEVAAAAGGDTGTGGGVVGLGEKLRSLVAKGVGGGKGSGNGNGSGNDGVVKGATRKKQRQQPTLNEAFTDDFEEIDDGQGGVRAGESPDEASMTTTTAMMTLDAEPSPYASIIRERYLRQQAAERAKEHAERTNGGVNNGIATTNTSNDVDNDNSSNNNNRERTISAPESLDIDVDSRSLGADDSSLAGRGGVANAGARGSGGGLSGGNRYSLAFSPSTPCALRLLVPLLVLLTHALFVYGQFAPMWRLRLFAHVDAWANATQAVARRTVEAIGLPWQNHFSFDYDGDVETFTYGFAIQKLWAADGMPSKFGPRLSAVLLALFSGVWPHLKLLLLQLNFWVPRRTEARTGALYWLSGFGKYSLADVLVVCVMIAVVHLDWDVDPGAIRDGVMKDLPLLMDVFKKTYTPMQACERLLHEPCSQPHHYTTKCFACFHTVSIACDHPNWAETGGRDVLGGFSTSGGGSASLRIAGMRGIYVFCAAATLSLLIGVLVDWLDHRARRHRASSGGVEHVAFSPEEEMRIDFASGESAPPSAMGRSVPRPPPEAFRSHPPRRSRRARSGTTAAAAAAARRQRRDNLCEPLLRHGTHTLPSSRGATFHLLNRVPEGSPFSSEHSYTLLFFSSLFAVALAILAATLPTMERQVQGAIPRLMNEVLGVRWYRRFSLWTLAEVTGDAGGADYLLMATFALFIVVGPLVRAALVAIDLAFPLSECAHENLTYCVNVLGAFCAWDVLGIAAFMVMLEMPSITDTILVRPECRIIDSGGQCLEVQFNLLPSFYWLVALGGGLLLAVSVAVVRMGMRATNPYRDGDEGGPYLCGCFLRGGCCRPVKRSEGQWGGGVGGGTGAYRQLGVGEESQNVV